MTTLNAPGGIILFGGAQVATRRSADGSMYVVYTGERPDRPFGTYIYRILPNNRMEWVDYAPFTETRVDTSIESDGLYISFPVNRDRNPERVKIAGFITPAYPGGTQSFQPTPITINATDVDARSSIANLTRNVASELAKLRKETIGKINAIPKGISESSVRDIAWSLAADRMYAELARVGSPIFNLIKEIATGKR